MEVLIISLGNDTAADTLPPVDARLASAEATSVSNEIRPVQGIKWPPALHQRVQHRLHVLIHHVDVCASHKLDRKA
jgi:hypothetical protein